MRIFNKALNNTPHTEAITTLAVATATGTEVVFSGFPPAVQTIIIECNGLSTTGTGDLAFQIGDSGGIESAGYDSVSESAGSSSNRTDSFVVWKGLATDAFTGHMTLTNISGTTWISSHVGKVRNTGGTAGGGSKTLSGILTQLQVTHVSTDALNSGTINVKYIRTPA